MEFALFYPTNLQTFWQITFSLDALFQIISTDLKSVLRFLDTHMKKRTKKKFGVIE
jgi:hypothetical protein